MKVCIIGDAGHINLVSWVRHLANAIGKKIYVLTFNRPCEKTDGMIVHTLQTSLSGSKLRYIFGILEVRKAIGRIRPDILIGYRINSYGLMAVTTGFRPVAVVAQGSDIFYPRNSIVQKMLLRYVIKQADLLHTWATHMGDKLMEYGAVEEKMLVLPKGVDIDSFRPTDTQQADKAFTLISTRQLRKTYNHELVLKALPSVLKKVPKLEYMICGEGEHKGYLESLAKRLGIENHTRFLGGVKHEVLPSYLGSAQIYVSMQSSDGVSSSLLEAMACGVFPIVVAIEANRLWIKDGFNGFLVPVNDHVRLAQKIILAFENRKFRDKAKALNIELVRGKASMALNMRRTVEVYSKLIDDSGKNQKNHIIFFLMATRDNDKIQSRTINLQT